MLTNIIYNEDCCVTMSKFQNESIDFVITSPPYDNLRKYKGYSFDFDKISVELYRILKKGGVMVWIVGDQTLNGSESGTSFKQALKFMEIGFNLHDTMIYHKVGITLNHNRYEQEFEYMFVFSKGRPNTFNPIQIPCIWYKKDSDRTGQVYSEHDERNKRLRSGKDRGNIKAHKIKGNVWRYNVGFGHSSKDRIAFKHPAIFPEELVKDHVQSWTNENDLIYDPFMGSGTTAKICKMMNRKYIGSEISPEYCEIANERLSTPFISKDTTNTFF